MKTVRNMKRKRISGLLLAVILCAAAFSIGCSGANYLGDSAGGSYDWLYPESDNPMGDFDEIIEQRFVTVTDETKQLPVALTGNTAAFTQTLALIENGQHVPKDVVKIEEYLNYFDYGLPEVAIEDTAALSAAVMDTPWNSETKLLLTGVTTAKAPSEGKGNNLVFLVDTSGSMSGATRIGLAKTFFHSILETLTERDTVSIVTYAGGVRVELEGVSGAKRTQLSYAVDKLSTGGATAGGRGIQTAYECALRFASEDVHSSVILVSDGDFNVGASTPDELKTLVTEYRRRGVYLSVFGVGMGNLSDRNMQQLALSGQGMYGYINNESEAKSLGGGGAAGLTHIAAEEAKAAIAFNPETVEKYRIIGHETRRLTNEEWEDASTQAGALTGSRTYIAVFEIQLKSGASETDLAEFTLRYREPGGDEPLEKSLLIEPESNTIPATECTFISAVIEFGLLLRDSEYKGTSSYTSAFSRIRDLDGVQDDAAKHRFCQVLYLLAQADS